MNVNDSFISRLPEADQIAIAESRAQQDTAWQSRLPEADQVAIVQARTGTAPAAEPEEIASPAEHSVTPTPPASPQEAVEAIWNLPAPSYSALSAIPEVVRGDYHTELVEAHNAHRAELARSAVEQFAPTLDDFSALPPSIARLEYDTALADYRNSPFVQELGRIQDEATSNPTELPANPANLEPSTVRVADLSLTQQSGMLAALGIELPENPTPAELAAGAELLAALPESVIGSLFGSGFEVSFNAPVAGAGTPGFVPYVQAGVSINAQGTFEMSEVHTGAGFQQTQTVRVEAEVVGEVDVGVGNNRSVLQSAYRQYERLAGLGLLSADAMNLVNQNPIARSLLRGTSLPVSFSTQSFAGSRVTYEAVVTPEQGARIADGELALPNPFEPLAMPTGTGVLLRGEALIGSSFEASYKFFQTNGSVTELQGLAFGVNRLEGDVVQIVAGPTELVENDFFVGLGKGPISIGIGSDRSLDEQQLQFAQLDLSTEAGQQAYQRFLTTGQLPGAGAEGVVQSGTQHVITYDHVSRAELNLGPLSLGGELNSSNTAWTTTEFADGTVGHQTVARINDRTLQLDYVTDADGDVITDQTVYTFVYADSDPALASYADMAFTGSEYQEFDGNQHIQLTFTNAELNELRGLALAELENVYAERPPEELQHVLANPFGFTQRLAATGSAEEAAELMLSHIGRYEDRLLSIAFSQETLLPGSIDLRPS